MTKLKARKQPQLLLDTGDVIKTHPRDGYWGAAVVLQVSAEGGMFAMSCHIGITPIVFRHDYAFAELDVSNLSILEFHRGIRGEPFEYGQRREVCIGIYKRKVTTDLSVLGRVDSACIRTPSLPFQIGNGSDGGWPLCRLGGNFGSEAIDEWRRVHDRVRYLDEGEKAALSHEAMLQNFPKNQA